MLPSPLTVLLLLFYLLLVAAAVTGWFALTLRSRLERGSRERAAVEERADEAEAPRPSNDEIRGFNARAERAARPAADDEDPFDRFLRSKSDELKL